MKVILLAGGFGSRFVELTKKTPKPLIKINNKSIIYHLIDHFAYYNFTDFVICCGYKYHLLFSDFIKYFKSKRNFKLKKYKNKIELTFVFNNREWNILLINTGLYTNTGGRINKIKKILYNSNDDNFFLTYSDGLSNINLSKLYKFHLKEKSQATVTVVKTSNQFGVVEFKNNRVIKFNEKPKNNFHINAGFFLLNKSILKYVKKNSDIWEKDCIPSIARRKMLIAFKHSGFWQSMDSVNDKNKLDKYLKSNPKFYKT